MKLDKQIEDFIQKEVKVNPYLATRVLAEVGRKE